MNIKIENCNAGFRIVSLALDKPTKDDLLKDKLDFLYIAGNRTILFPDNIILSESEEIAAELNSYLNYDVFELWDDGFLRQCYNDASTDNYFFITSRCNSNCIMCPSAPQSRKRNDSLSINDHILVANHIPSDVQHLTITGGEPFLVGEDIFRLFSFLKEKFPKTEILVLTNGRVFALDKYVDKMRDCASPFYIFAIPIHGSTAGLHDLITQVNGSFCQTLTGIRKLLSVGLRVELRIVVSKLNYEDFENIAHLIVEMCPQIEYVSVIAMEMTGSAALNRNIVWLPYRETADAIESGVMHLIHNGIDTRLYNFPLCTVNSRFWPLCKKSISPDKVRYSEKCAACKYKSSCGGLFAGTMRLEEEELEPIQ